ncbi:hypothetical protein PINS_up010216 [Pythium insidiosum]|nr:hypothetical protein PINS_up010216 [Pythium insidiosum]
MNAAIGPCRFVHEVNVRPWPHQVRSATWARSVRSNDGNASLAAWRGGVHSCLKNVPTCRKHAVKYWQTDRISRHHRPTTIASQGARRGNDVKLDQWGIGPRRSGESLSTYIDRIFDSPLFRPGFRDICLWSLSTDGAAEENRWVETLSNVYYYSYSNVDTFAWRDWLLRKIQLPNLLTMLLPLQPLGTFLGGRYAPNNGFTEEWQPNDGVVPTISMDKDARGQMRSFDGVSVRGQWNRMPQLSRMDHLAVVGVTLHTQVKDFYTAHAQLLASLPESSSAKRSLQETDAAVAPRAPPATVGQLVGAVVALNSAANDVKTEQDLLRLCAGASTDAARAYCSTMLKAPAPAPTRRLRGVRA